MRAILREEKEAGVLSVNVHIYMYFCIHIYVCIGVQRSGLGDWVVWGVGSRVWGQPDAGHFAGALHHLPTR